MTTFTHKQLNHSTPSIRVVKVLPDLVDGLICCRIEHTLLSSTYIALSYTWSDVLYPRTVYLNGELFQVRKNLWRFLNIARTCFSNTWLWIDAMCIDQTNIAERNHQVRQMGKLYAEAHLVLVWLGTGNANSRYVFKTLGSKNLHQLTTFGLEQGDKFWEEVTRLLNSEYWSRLWIIQELLLASTIQLVCGKRTLTWDRLSCFTQAATNQSMTYPPRSIQQRILGSAAYKFCSLRRHDADAVTMYSKPLGELVTISKTSKCSDIRDRLFGLLSLAIGGERFPVDYTGNECDIFHEAIHLFWSSGGVRLALDIANTFQFELEDLWSSLPLADIMPANQDAGVPTFPIWGLVKLNVRKLFLDLGATGHLSRLCKICHRDIGTTVGEQKDPDVLSFLCGDDSTDWSARVIQTDDIESRMVVVPPDDRDRQLPGWHFDMRQAIKFFISGLIQSSNYSPKVLANSILFFVQYRPSANQPELVINGAPIDAVLGGMAMANDLLTPRMIQLLRLKASKELSVLLSMFHVYADGPPDANKTKWFLKNLGRHVPQPWDPIPRLQIGYDTDSTGYTHNLRGSGGSCKGCDYSITRSSHSPSDIV